MAAESIIDGLRHRLPAGIVRRLPDGRRRAHFRIALKAGDFDRLPLIVGDKDPFRFSALFAAIDILLSNGAEDQIDRLAPLAEGKNAFERGIFKAINRFGQGHKDRALKQLDKYGSGDRFDHFRRMSARAWALFLRLPRLAETKPISAPAPKIVQFWDDPNVPADVMAGIARWQKQSGFEHRLVHREEARDFLATTYGPDAAQNFDACPHPAIQCDYFRLGWLAEHGGLYVDADDTMADGFKEFAPLLAGRLVVDFRSDLPNGYFNNAFIAAPKGSATIRAAFDEATRRLSQSTDGHPFTLAGPGVYTDTLINCAQAGHLEETAVVARSFLKKMVRGVQAQYKGDGRNWPVWLQAQGASA